MTIVDIQKARTNAQHTRKWRGALLLSILLVMTLFGMPFAYRSAMGFLEYRGLVDADRGIAAPLELEVTHVVRDAALHFVGEFEVKDGVVLNPEGYRFVDGDFNIKPENGAWLVVYCKLRPRTDSPRLETISLLSEDQEVAQLSGVAQPSYAAAPIPALNEGIGRLYKEKATPEIGFVFFFPFQESTPSVNLKIRLQWRTEQGALQTKRFRVADTTAR